jgi:starvation-inducible DNA-binding protein
MEVRSSGQNYQSTRSDEKGNDMLEKKLNALLANYEVMYHKLQTYHWYVYGPTFFADHAQLEAYYEQAYKAVDAIGEAILMIGGLPVGTMSGWLEAATIKEAKEERVSPIDVYTNVRADFQTLLKMVTEIKELAEKDECNQVTALADGLIEELSKNVWMLGNVLA